MASVVQPEISSEMEKKDVQAAGEEDNNPEEPMDDEDENDDGGDGDDEDVEEDVVVQIGATYSCKRQDGSYHDAEIVKTRMNKRAGREEFFVNYVGLNRRQNEWVDKTRLVIPKPVKEGQVADRANLGATEEGKATLKRTSDESPSEAKRVKVDVETAPSNNSAMASKDFAEELTCLLCSELFKDPVMVECGHNFCRNCIDKAWDGQESFTCPDCKEVLTEKRYNTKKTVANLVKTAVCATAISTPAKSAKKVKLAENCLEHDERLKLFCKDDGTLSCIICRDSLKHASHNFLPILDAVGVYKTEMLAIVAPLEEGLKETEHLTSQQGEKVEQLKSNVSETQQHIVSEFEKLRTFLKAREENLLEQLQEQGENLLKEMETNLVKLQESQDTIKETIAMANERTHYTDSVSFLTGIKSLIEKCQEQQKDVMVAENTVLSKDLCQGTFKGPIQYSIWKQMQSFIAPLESVQEPTSSNGPETLPLPSVPVGHAIKPNSSVAAAGPQNRHGVKTVWIVGHSFVHWAQVRAAKHPYGTQLGFPKKRCNILWFGEKDLLWSGMEQLIARAAEQNPPPDILVIHAGGNDLTSYVTSHLIEMIKKDIDHWMSVWPWLKVVWSRIIQRRYWQNVTQINKVELSRRKVNTAITTFLKYKAGSIVDHDNIKFRNSNLYRADGEHLSNTGLDLFNKSLQEALIDCL
ncbi:nuclear factor 7, brain-like isoform X2 [Eleutherodactylus coqui]|uniref:nuclear factor 7, brain-like isoform X2 n=1 Tax=Eleutherodactylus coqui TaxID=57060 RepID=UPI00346298FC